MSPARGALRAFTPQQLVPLLPERLGDWQRESLESPRGGRRPGPTLRAEYAQGRLSASISLFDERRAEPASQHEAFDATTREASVTRSLGNGLTVVVLSRSADVATLQALVATLDLAAALALQRP
ncbi:MAG: hypothetical protein KF788_17000 [Piscinibacter sp.]|nr:hypothetical protein [Piscinibacter sp.]